MMNLDASQLRKALKSAATAISFERIGNADATKCAALIAGEKCKKAGQTLDSFYDSLKSEGISDAFDTWHYIVDGYYDGE